jgi:hypothetical protein
MEENAIKSPLPDEEEGFHQIPTRVWAYLFRCAPIAVNRTVPSRAVNIELVDRAERRRGAKSAGRNVRL